MVRVARRFVQVQQHQQHINNTHASLLVTKFLPLQAQEEEREADAKQEHEQQREEIRNKVGPGPLRRNATYGESLHVTLGASRRFCGHD